MYHNIPLYENKLLIVAVLLYCYIMIVNYTAKLLHKFVVDSIITVISSSFFIPSYYLLLKNCAVSFSESSRVPQEAHAVSPCNRLLLLPLGRVRRNKMISLRPTTLPPDPGRCDAIFLCCRRITLRGVEPIYRRPENGQ